MRVIACGEKKITVELSYEELEGISGVSTSSYSHKFISKSNLEGMEFDLKSFISSVYNTRLAIETKESILQRLELAKEYIEKVYFPLKKI